MPLTTAFARFEVGTALFFFFLFFFFFFFLLGLVGVSILHVEIVGLWKCALLVVLLLPLCRCGCSRAVGVCKGSHVDFHQIVGGGKEPNNTDCICSLLLS
jgi:hypothetical protein